MIKILPSAPLYPGTLIRRYKRFIVDVRLEDGSIISAHCPNSGSMLTCSTSGNLVLLSKSSNPKRKLPYTLELYKSENGWVSVNTLYPNRVVAEGITQGRIMELSSYERMKIEAPTGDSSRLDILLEGTGRPLCHVEIKNCTLLARDGTEECIAGPTAKLESGVVAVGSDYLTVNLVNTYVDPVVVCSVQYNSNTVPVVTRVSDVTSTSFKVKLQNPSGADVNEENVNYLVVEKGVWSIDGVNIEAQKYTSTVTDENGNWVGEDQSYGQNYTNPVVLGQVMTENDDWSVFWCQGSSRTDPPSATVLKTSKTVCEDSDVTRNDETIGFIVLEEGHGTIGGVEYEAALGGNSVGGVGNSPPYTYSFDTAFDSAPQVAVVTMAGVDGGNPLANEETSDSITLP